MFFCALSGEPPQEPVVSAKSGHVYEKRLITKYIAENGTDPISGDKLTEDELITVQASTYHPATIRSSFQTLVRPEHCASTTPDPQFNTCPPTYTPERMGLVSSRTILNKPTV